MSNQPQSRTRALYEWLAPKLSTEERKALDAIYAASSETGRIVNDRTSADLRRFFDRVAEESLGDYPWKVETALLAVYRLGREDERGERPRFPSDAEVKRGEG